jgi:hypothetical protein
MPADRQGGRVGEPPPAVQRGDGRERASAGGWLWPRRTHQVGQMHSRFVRAHRGSVGSGSTRPRPGSAGRGRTREPLRRATLVHGESRAWPAPTSARPSHRSRRFAIFQETMSRNRRQVPPGGPALARDTGRRQKTLSRTMAGRPVPAGSGDGAKTHPPRRRSAPHPATAGWERSAVGGTRIQPQGLTGLVCGGKHPTDQSFCRRPRSC